MLDRPALPLIFYAASVHAINLFGGAFPNWFVTLPDSLFTLFRLMTLASWAMGIARPALGTFPWASFFFVLFALFTAFIILNIFIAVIINGMNEARNQELKEAKSLEGGRG